MSESLPASYFEKLYAADPDPWRFATSDYEREKYAATLAALPARRSPVALEVGCSIGVLTRALADRCDRLLAIDVAEAALEQARARCADAPHVAFARARIPAEWPSGSFDLIVLSEVLYYLSPSDIDAAAQAASRALRTDTTVVLVHWTEPTNYPVTGDEAAERFIDDLRPTTTVTHQERRPKYRLDVLRAR